MGNVTAEQHNEKFALSTPALVCRWRLAGGGLPLEGRHMRALGRRLLGNAYVSPQLVAWAKQHIEWTLTDGARTEPDGVLMLVVDDKGRAAMSVGPYRPLRAATASALAERAQSSAKEGKLTGVSPETIWALRGNDLYWGIGRGETASGAASLMDDLARTIGFAVIRRGGLADEILNDITRYDEVFLVSDEHGIVLSSNVSGPRSERFAAGYAKLLAREREKPRMR